ncbi:MAG: hypothetical protein QOI23_2703, partial [Chloroflexota bacterium]|nr:hypothetical protein [Chloroflexota bacterium]
FTTLSCEETTRHLEHLFAQEFSVHASALSDDEVEAARVLVAAKYGTPAWVNRLP